MVAFDSECAEFVEYDEEDTFNRIEYDNYSDLEVVVYDKGERTGSVDPVFATFENDVYFFVEQYGDPYAFRKKIDRGFRVLQVPQ